MFMSHRNWIGLSLALVVASFGPGSELAQGASDQDAAEISAYALSVAGLEKYRQATTNLAQLGEALSQNCDEDQDDQSLDAMAAEIRGIPGATEAERFDNAIRMIRTVSKADLLKAETEWKRARAHKKRTKK